VTRRGGCPTPQKVDHSSRHAAAEAASDTSKFGETAHAYQCECGYWHVTTSRRLNQDENWTSYSTETPER
jgi:ABC-type nickel/cobalt efflux system permease component RcnA